MKAKAFELVKQSASSGLRTKLAAALVEEHVKIDPKDPIDEFLLAANPLNCGAQLVFYEKGKHEQGDQGHAGAAVRRLQFDGPGPLLGHFQREP